MEKLFQAYEHHFSVVDFNKIIPDNWDLISKFTEFIWYCKKGCFVEFEGKVYQFRKSNLVESATRDRSRIVLKNGRHILNAFDID